MDFKILKQLVEAPGVAGREETVREIIINLFKPLVDEIKVDAIGNILAVKKGKGTKKLMLCSHMDEVGFIVNFIDNDGYLKFLPQGGIDQRTLPSQRVIVHTASGPVKGVIGVKAAHLVSADEASKALPMKSLFIDIGMNKEQAQKVITLGDPITYDTATEEMGYENGYIVSKAIDCRAGVYVIYEVLKQLKNHDADICVAITAQEEVGCRGAKSATEALNPDLALIIDPTAASDIPGVAPVDFNTVVGKGVVINAVDRETIAHPLMLKALTDTAKENKINYQIRITNIGGNDTGNVQKSGKGVVAASIAVPNRYIHSCSTVSKKSDIDEAVKLAKLFAENCTKYNYDF